MLDLLKVSSRDCVSLLTTCNMSKIFFQVFFWCNMLSGFKHILSHLLGWVKVNKIATMSFK